MNIFHASGGNRSAYYPALFHIRHVQAGFPICRGQTLVSVVKAVTVYSMISVMVVTLLGIPGIPRTIGIIQPLLVFPITSLRLFTALWLGKASRSFSESSAS